MNLSSSTLSATERSTYPKEGKKQSRKGAYFLCRKIVLRSLAQLQHGQLRVRDAEGTTTLGETDRDSLHVVIQVIDPSFYQDIVLGGSMGVAEAYMQGKWTCDDLTSLIRIFCRNWDHSANMNRGLGRITFTFAQLAHRFSRNTMSGSRKNIAAHYDLSNDFFQLFLDPTLMYSSAYFSQVNMSLEQAAVEKLDRICQRLDLKSTDHILEIGTGWGGFALHAVKNYGCRVTTTTISQQQYLLAKQRVADQHLGHRIELLTEDYRNLRGEYDKIVSIEMIEAVGQEYLKPYFRQCHQLLRPGGSLLIQAITMPDQRYATYCRSVDFIQKYIFPGGHLPSVGAMQTAASTATNLRLIQQEDFGLSYALTLREWRQRFFASLDAVRSLGFDERFIRMWDYYLCYCEGAFLEQSVGVSHLLWKKSIY